MSKKNKYGIGDMVYHRSGKRLMVVIGFELYTDKIGTRFYYECSFETETGYSYQEFYEFELQKYLGAKT